MLNLINNATIVNEGRQFQGAVVVDGEYIIDVLEQPLTDVERFDNVIDATGLYLLPGVIDDHVHFREPGLTHKADIATESRTAAAGGVTSFMDMPNTVPQTTTPDLLEEKFQLGAEKSRVNYSFFVGATNENAYLLPSIDRTRVPGIKLFMGSSTGNMLVDDDAVLHEIFRSSPVLIMAHCEDQHIIELNIADFKRKYKGQNDFPVRYHSRIRSVEACYESSSKAVQLARETGARLHIAHVSTAKELELFDDNLDITQKQITAEAAIAHLMFSTEDYDHLGARIKCNPSVKTPEDREALREALAMGQIDVVATDHAPHLLREKSNTYFNAPSGIPSIQEALPALLELAHKGLFSVEQVVERYSHAPATLFGIVDRGHLREGYKADVVLVDPDCPWTPTRGDTFCKCGWSPFEGERFRNKVIRTWVNGDLVWNADDPGAEVKSRGQRLEFLGRS